MTTSRIVRGTKIRIFLSLCAIVVILGLLACYNNTITQLDETQKEVEICHQQQENLSIQLQVISDYKLRLEKALKNEKADHAKSNASFVETVKDERVKNEKTSKDAQMRIDSLQQKYNLLQIEYDDFKEKSAKHQEEQHKMLKDLQNTLKDLDENMNELKKSKENLKTEVVNLQIENGNLKRQQENHESDIMGNENKTNFLQKKNIELRRELDLLKDKCPGVVDNLQETLAQAQIKETPQKFDQAQINKNVLDMPNTDNKNGVKSSSPASSKLVSQGSLNGARPLAVPTFTPNQKKTENEVPDGVLPIPRKFPDIPIGPVETQKEIVDNRYKNQIDDESNKKKLEETEKDNNANEDLDQNLDNDGIEFGDSEKRNIGRKHIDTLRINKEGDNQAAGDYQVNDQMENNGIDEGEDDDQDEYGDHLMRRKDTAVRN